jgi:hypothetical protein
MTERVEDFDDRRRGEDVERAHEHEGDTEDPGRERSGESVEGGGDASPLR